MAFKTATTVTTIITTASGGEITGFLIRNKKILMIIKLAMIRTLNTTFTKADIINNAEKLREMI